MATPTEVFKAISLPQLQKIVKHERIVEREDVDLNKKSAVVKVVTHECLDAGLRQLVTLFKLATLQDICEPLELDLTDKNPNHKPVYQKRLKEKMLEMGIAEFLTEYMDVRRLKIFVEVLGEKPESEKKADLVSQTTGLIHFAGIQAFLSQFDTSFLQEMMQEMKLEGKSENKSKILHAIATMTDIEEDEKTAKPRIRFSKEKRDIEKGITYQDVFQHYYLEELQEWARKNDLKVSGTKPELIRRILAFLDGDTENTVASNRTAEKKPTTPKKEAKKESKKELKEEQVEEETKKSPKKSPKKSVKA